MSTKVRVDQYFQAKKLLARLYEGDKEKAAEWLEKPNHLFFDMTPEGMIFGGRGASVLDKLEEWLTEDTTQ